MKRRSKSISGINLQRGFWLRCFLEHALFAALLTACASVSASAQISMPTPYRVSHLRGLFVDGKGNPIPDADVTLDRDDKTYFSTKTDNAGRFEIKHVSGRYGLHIKKLRFSMVARDVIVGVDAVAHLRGATLYIIDGPAACTDDCSQVFTSKDKFDRAIRNRSGHQD
jgi:hypothetical protein